ncbi:MAG: histidine kinase [Rhizobacter sp.]|nr:histidine kinase [Rhizobacter sp.]
MTLRQGLVPPSTRAAPPQSATHGGDVRVSQSDLDACAGEPIRIPGSIQPHGCLLVLDAQAATVLQASTNASALLGFEWPASGAVALHAIPGASQALLPELLAWRDDQDATFSRAIALGAATFYVAAHRTAQGILLEFEPTADGRQAESLDAMYPRLRRFLDAIEPINDSVGLGRIAAREVRDLTGFNRVMVYRFDEDGHGTVVAEDGDGVLPSYLDLRFPASDIPAQARELYRLNRLRLIATADYAPVPLVPATNPLDGQPVDLSMAALRSVSPIHLEYMRNMGTGASMSISLVIDGRLWGLISCHHRDAHIVSPPVRTACDFLGQTLALQIGARERGAHSALRLELKSVEGELLARLSRAASVEGGLTDNPQAWLQLAGAQGAAVLRDGVLVTAGQTPTLAQIQALAGWLHRRRDPLKPVFATESLAADFSPARDFADVGSGLLAVPISEIHPHFILWFRPEVRRTVQWGGDPNKPADADAAQRLHPRRSFEQWSQELRLRSQRWQRAEIEAAHDLRNAIVSFVLRSAEERAQLTEKLERSNNELEAFSYSVSHDLRAPFRHITGFAQLLGEHLKNVDAKSSHYLRSIVDAAGSAGQLVDDLLMFSQLGRSSLTLLRVDMNKLLREVRHTLEPDLAGRQIDWRVGELPEAWGDPSLLRQALTNLLDNAVKYTQPNTQPHTQSNTQPNALATTPARPPVFIEVTGEQRLHETVYTVADNGVGFDMAYVSKLFGVFQRLHRAEEFEGSGIGLALTRRIIDRHGGWIRAEGVLNQGAVFKFGIPRRNKE